MSVLASINLIGWECYKLRGNHRNVQPITTSERNVVERFFAAVGETVSTFRFDPHRCPCGSAMVLKSGSRWPVNQTSSTLRWHSRSSRRLDWTRLKYPVKPRLQSRERINPSVV